MFARVRGDIALANSVGFVPSSNGIDGQLGLGDTEASPYLRLRTDIDKHRVRLHGFGFESNGSARLANAYGNIPGGSTVNTSLDFYGIAANYSFQILRDEHFRVAVGGALGYYALDVAATLSGGGGREEVETEALVPMPYIEAEAFIDDFTFGANLGIMSADLGDANGRYIDFETYADWRVADDFDVKLGYRFLLLDAYGEASSRDFDADVDVQGFYLTAGVRF